MVKIEILNNTADNCSILVNRNMQLQINPKFKVKVKIEIIIMQDDDGNFRLDSETTDIISVYLDNKKTTGYTNIQNFIKEYDKANKTNLNKNIKIFINNHYKNYKSTQIKDLAKEYNINL